MEHKPENGKEMKPALDRMEVFMVKKILTIAMVLAILPQIFFVTTAEATTSNQPESSAAQAYRAYYEILKAAIDRHGVLKKIPGSEEFEYTDADEFELSYAELIDFGNEGLPSLLYVSSYGMYKHCYIYGYSDGKAELYLTWLTGDPPTFTAAEGPGGSNFHGFEIATDKNGRKYLRVYMYWRELEDDFYTVKNGEWLTDLSRHYDFDSLDDEDITWYVNGNLVKYEFFENAPETELGIVDTCEIPESPDTVHAVLAELEEKVTPAIEQIKNSLP